MPNSKLISTSFWLVLFAVFVGFCTFYAPQPLLPEFTQQFGLTPASSARLLTLPFLSLAIGPVVVGVLIQKARARLLLATVMCLLGIGLLGFAITESFEWKLGFRLLQSVLLPILFTAGVAYASQAGAPQFRQRRIALYITTSILGGFSGRLLSGFIADSFGLSAPFYVFGLLTIASAISIASHVRNLPLQAERLSGAQMLNVLSGKPMRLGLALVFCTFFTFSGVLTTLPFRLVDLYPDISSASISAVYAGYAIGIFIPIVLDRLLSHGLNERRAIQLGALLLCIGLIGLTSQSTVWIMLYFLVLSTGMFTIHATAAGWLNKLNPDHTGIVNGAYISNYYSAAAIASVVPLWLVQWLGWNVYIASQLLLASIAFLLLRELARAVAQREQNAV